MSANPSRSPRRVVIVAFPEVQLLDIAGPSSVFTTATKLVGPKKPGYHVEVAALRPGPVATEGGLLLQATVPLARVRGEVDTLLVPGGMITMSPDSELALSPHLRRLAGRCRRVASVCTGSFLLARAGLLEGKRATTHWLACDALKEQHPGCEVQGDQIYLRDGRIWTSAGVTSGIDLALALVEEDLGRNVARQVARLLVVYLRRPGGQSQFSVQMASQWASRAPIRDVQEWLPEHLQEDLSVEKLARRAAMSPRNFARAFRDQVGVTPARYVERMRLEAARASLESTQQTVKEIATEVGFGTLETMHRVFKRALGVTPADYRGRFAAQA
ncbi:GlxA family transcriptional regulator [Pyxidicoccus xibeiensis]|uniref:GlxA family transcriptional regulator n=1 Tax=Pyxidicoccus xibeiensis TaxID=2906759 RepID=UPI0020A7B27B|nr:GlxA family transcriptional regulator [Pyxidicoccus xibeiensis]MCP3140958.1 GlxA family transcriptional regulator [Pyxidicoccus xibeiensis]